MRPFILLGFIWLWMVQPAAAQSFAGCSDAQATVIKDAIGGAKDLSLKAAVAVGDTPEFTRWFGDYSDANAERVRASLKSVVTAIRGGSVTAECQQVVDDGCASDEYAYVFSDEPYLMYLCPTFFNLPGLEALRPGSRTSDNGTREGTIIHEVSHFLHVAATDDHCYSRSECIRMARSNPRRAVDNADSYQYYAEDVTHFARQPVTDKPPPAPRTDR
jgi:peptidyl-Lys metalloendopeptidase